MQDKFPGNVGYFDFIYLDPPFNSNKNYNVLFKEGLIDSEAQTHAFEDTWHWTHEAQKEFDWLVQNANSEVSELMQALRRLIGQNGNDMLAYLTMMTRRLIELHRVLKPTGSIYLHCDPTASHYLKIVMDAIFGKQNFRNEIVWKRTFAHNDPLRFGKNDDRILFYTKSNSFFFKPVLAEYDPSYVDSFFNKEDERGKYQTVTLTGPKVNPRDPSWKGYTPATSGRSWSIPKRLIKLLAGDSAKELSTLEKLDLLESNNYIVFSKNGVPRFKQYLHEMVGAPVQEIWTDINPLSAHSAERLGYPTQKPEALLERILAASTEKSSWVLDPFCGCGTTVSVAEKMKRNWVGIDISMLSVKLIERRLVHTNYQLKNQIHINGLPRDMAAAKDLAAREPFDFEYWVAVHLLDAKPPAGKSKDNMKGADRGVDGIITLITKAHEGQPDEYGKAIVQVKGGNVQRSDISTLISDVARDKANAGIFICLKEPTRRMIEEAAQAGKSKTDFGEFSKIQILTVEELMNGKKPNLPGMISPYKQALGFNPTIPQTSLL